MDESSIIARTHAGRPCRAPDKPDRTALVNDECRNSELLLVSDLRFTLPLLLSAYARSFHPPWLRKTWLVPAPVPSPSQPHLRSGCLPFLRFPPTCSRRGERCGH